MIDMRKGSLYRGRLALATAVIAVAVGLVLPATAFAHAPTRLAVTKQVVANWGTPGSRPATPVVTVKLQRKSGTRWYSLRGTVKIYFYDRARQVNGVLAPGWVYRGSKTGSTVYVSLPARGRYKLAYGGSSTMKPATSYTQRLDRIGETISNITPTFTTIDATWTRVDVSYDVSWNTEAYAMAVDDPLEVSFLGTFETSDGSFYSGYVFFSQQIWVPGTTTFSYRVRTADIPDAAVFDTTGHIVSDDDYIQTTAAPVTDSTPFSVGP